MVIKKNYAKNHHISHSEPQPLMTDNQVRKQIYIKKFRVQHEYPNKGRRY